MFPPLFGRSPEFNDFLRKALDKNVDRRWCTAQLLQVNDSITCISNDMSDNLHI